MGRAGTNTSGRRNHGLQFPGSRSAQHGGRHQDSRPGDPRIFQEVSEEARSRVRASRSEAAVPFQKPPGRAFPQDEKFRLFGGSLEADGKCLFRAVAPLTECDVRLQPGQHPAALHHSHGQSSSPSSSFSAASSSIHGSPVSSQGGMRRPPARSRLRAIQRSSVAAWRMSARGSPPGGRFGGRTPRSRRARRRTRQRRSSVVGPSGPGPGRNKWPGRGGRGGGGRRSCGNIMGDSSTGKKWQHGLRRVRHLRLGAEPGAWRARRSPPLREAGAGCRARRVPVSVPRTSWRGGEARVAVSLRRAPFPRGRGSPRRAGFRRRPHFRAPAPVSSRR